ncbi:MAG: HAD family hydrolase [Marinilabiliales bacterium]|nr:HAD family hydrolase [Marinilabiliales bacterium]
MPESLEKARKLDIVVLDKTGTITQGKPDVHEIIWLKSKLDQKIILEEIVAIEERSEHPLAESIVKHFR